MSHRSVTDADIALVRGVKNCGEHHPENETAPAIQFAQKCDVCAGDIFIVVWNACRARTEEHLRKLGFK